RRPPHRPDALALARVHMPADDVPALRLRVHDHRVRRVDLVVEAVAARDVVPVAVADAVLRERLARPAPRAVVLEPAADVVGIAHVGTDLVELTDGEVVVVAPG